MSEELFDFEEIDFTKSMHYEVNLTKIEREVLSYPKNSGACHHPDFVEDW
ncbi:hypothetical protein [Neobacillus sp. 19]